MPPQATFPYADALACLDSGEYASFPADLVDSSQKRGVLLALLKGDAAMHRAAVRTAQVSDALRRDQKFVRPGPPSAHLIGLRQQQAAARQATNQARQAFIVAADALVRTFALDVPAHAGLELFARDWMQAQLPRKDGSGSVV